jgi:hypothetical protein
VERFAARSSHLLKEHFSWGCLTSYAYSGFGFREFEILNVNQQLIPPSAQEFPCHLPPPGLSPAVAFVMYSSGSATNFWRQAMEQK